MLIRTVLAYLFFCFAIPFAASAGSDEAHADSRVAMPSPEIAADAPYQVTVDGQSVPIEPGTRLQKTYVARFWTRGPVQVTVRAAAASQASFFLRPRRYSADVKADAHGVSFQVADHAPRIVKADGLPYLFLFPEPRLPGSDASAPDVIAITANDGSVAEHTRRIQSAVDRLSAAGGGTVHLRAGIHRSRVIHLKDRVTLHLAAGAVLRGTGRPEDYKAAHGRLALILVDRAEEAKICGQGIIDGLGHVLQKKHGVKARLIDALSCRRFEMSDVFLRDPGAWTVHLIGCSDVKISRVKVLGDWRLANTDGINPDMSDNVRIEECFIYSGDDAIAVKATGGLGIRQAAHHIAAKDCLIMTRKTSCKIGTESRYDIHDVLFENIEIVDSSRGCALWMRDGATYSDITYRDIRMNLMRLPGEKWSGEAYRVSIQERHGKGKMQRILFDRVVARSPQRSILFSEIRRPLRGVTFRNCVWRADTDGTIPHVEVDNAEDISFVNCSIERKDERQPFPEHLIQGPSRHAVEVRGE